MEYDQEVRQDRAELRALASELVLTEERERRRLATDLHDGAQQALELARIRLGLLRRSPPADDGARGLAEVERLLEQGLAALRTLTFELNPPVLHDLGLSAALRWLADDLARSRGLRVEVVDDGQREPLDERIRVLLFRSARELLLNVAKHARVSCARVSLRKAGEALVLSVADEGVGFEPARLLGVSQGGGFGLFSIRQRLMHLGGGMEVASRPGRGTTVLLRVPLAPEPVAGGRR